jgi:hypothetical protein
VDHADRGTAITIALLWLTFVGLTVVLISWITEDLGWEHKLLPAYLLVIPGSVVLALALRIARRLAMVGGSTAGTAGIAIFLVAVLSDEAKFYLLFAYLAFMVGAAVEYLQYKHADRAASPRPAERHGGHGR